MEVGAANFGPVIIESAISSDIKEQNMHQEQQKFLKRHDDKLKKLWFLWPELNKTTAKCGCTGGCAFFGANRNGTRFFKPSKSDVEEGVNVAAFRVNEPGKDPGYGQSILHEGQLLFRTPPYVLNEISLQDTLTRPKPQRKHSGSPRVAHLERCTSVEKDSQSYSSPGNSAERKVNRRFSSTSMR